VPPASGVLAALIEPTQALMLWWFSIKIWEKPKYSTAQFQLKLIDAITFLRE
jgi:hypothetical protein